MGISRDIRHYSHHAFICINGNCANPRMGQALQLDFIDLATEYGIHRVTNPHHVKCTLSDCFGVCGQGPIMVVYPEGIWYYRVNRTVLKRIIEEHLIGGQPVEEYILKRQIAPNEAMQGKTVSAVADFEPHSSPSQKVQRYLKSDAKQRGVVVLFTGNGKGKSSAALGTMARAWGHDMKVGVVQFLRNERPDLGDVTATQRMGFEWLTARDDWQWQDGDVDETQAIARHGWEIAQKAILETEHDLLILEEFTYPLHFGWLDTKAVIEWLMAHKPPQLHLMITGRYAPKSLLDYADVVTEMKEVKHSASDNLPPQCGIDF